MQVLVLQSSLRLSDSVTRRMVDAFVGQLRLDQPNALIRTRDLAASPIPHLPDELVAVQLGLSEVESPAAKLAEELIQELEASNLVVLGLPMYNFTVPSTVKAWFDHVVRARRTFTYGENGPIGLLPAGKRAVALVASGGAYDVGSPADFLEPYLRWMLGFIGINELTVIRAGQQAYGEQAEVAARVATDEARAIAAALPEHFGA